MYSDIVNENVTVLLKPVISHTKEGKDSELLEGIISLCCRWKVSQGLTNASIAFKSIGVMDRKELILQEIKAIFKNDQQYIDAIIPCYE